LTGGKKEELFAVVFMAGVRYIAAMEKIPMRGPDGCRPKISYPCLWQYTVIATSLDEVRGLVAEYLGDAPYSLSRSKTSSGGRYTSMVLEMTVHSDYHRLRLYEVLSAHPAVKVVL